MGKIRLPTDEWDRKEKREWFYFKIGEWHERIDELPIKGVAAISKYTIKLGKLFYSHLYKQYKLAKKLDREYRNQEMI